MWQSLLPNSTSLRPGSSLGPAQNSSSSQHSGDINSSPYDHTTSTMHRGIMCPPVLARHHSRARWYQTALHADDITHLHALWRTRYIQYTINCGHPTMNTTISPATPVPIITFPLLPERCAYLHQAFLAAYEMAGPATAAAQIRSHMPADALQCHGEALDSSPEPRWCIQPPAVHYPASCGMYTVNMHDVSMCVNVSMCQCVKSSHPEAVR
jgi:hypothetical protein